MKYRRGALVGWVRVMGCVCAGVFAAGCGSTGRGTAAAALPKLKPPPRFTSQADPSRYVFRAAPGVLDGASRSAPSELMVYDVVHTQPTRERICELAERVGVSVVPQFRASMPETVEGSHRRVGLIGELTSDIMAKQSNLAPDDKYVSYVSERVGGITGDNLVVLNMTVMDSGSFSLNLRGTRPDSEGEAPTEKEALAIAERFVERTGLLPEGCELEGVSTSVSVPAVQPGHGDVHEMAVGSEVVYQRYLDGYPVGQFVLQINGKGEISGVYRNALDLVPLAKYPILTPEEALEAVKAGRGTLSGPNLPGKDFGAVIEEIGIAYDEAPPGISCDTVQPIYRFRASIDGFHDGFSASVPAVRPEYLEEEATSKQVSGGGAGPESESESK